MVAFEHAAAKTTKVSPDCVIQAIVELGSIVEGLVAGQVMDLCNEGTEVNLSELEYIHVHKTAKLLEASVVCEVVDDILDVTKSEEELGKTAGKDLASNKATYPKLMGIDKAKKFSRILADQAMQEFAYFGKRHTSHIQRYNGGPTHSFLIPRSDSKIMGEKRSSAGLGDKDDSARGRVKMRDLDSVCRSEGINTHYKKSLKNKESSDQFQLGEEELSQVTEVPVSLDLDASQAEKTGRNSFPLAVNLAPRPLDLNTEVCVAEDSACGDGQICAENSNPPSLYRKRERVHDGKCLTSRGIGFDLNAEDVSSSVSPETSCYPSKIHGQLKSRDVSECESSLGPLGERDPKRRWEEMKQNGFLSSSYGGIPMPKQRMKKSKNDMIKKRMELAKREQVDRFTKIAAPSGLLNDLNPGIINHVRNRKQVHSIIEALVRSERLENENIRSKQTAHQRSGTTESGNRMDPENINDSRIHPVISHKDGHLNALSGIRQTGVYTMPMNKYSQSIVEGKRGRNELSMVETVCGKSHISHFTPLSEDTTPELKVSSSSQASENASSSSNEDSANFASTVKAASVASQWLELLHQDIQGRLSALRRSRKRVRAVISTELPFLISKEFSSSQVNTPYVMRNSIDEFSNSATADMHRARWNTLFDQMDKALSDEEKQLESWLNQVKEMQLHCEQGLQHVNWNAAFGLKQLGTSENDSRSRQLDSSDRELAVMAAAASIYSTSNFLLSENVSCF